MMRADGGSRNVSMRGEGRRKEREGRGKVFRYGKSTKALYTNFSNIYIGKYKGVWLLMKNVYIGTVKKVLNNSQGRTLTQIHKNTGITYSHVVNVVKMLEARGLVFSERVDRRRICKITPRGEVLRSALNTVW